MCDVQRVQLLEVLKQELKEGLAKLNAKPPTWRHGPPDKLDKVLAPLLKVVKGAPEVA
jgi:hypothetical protein